MLQVTGGAGVRIARRARRILLRAVASLLYVLVFSFALPCVGCGATPELKVSGAELAGDDILVQVHAYEYFMPMFSHVGEVRNSRHYLLRFPKAVTARTAVSPLGVASLPWSNTLDASYSPDRIILAQAPAIWFDQRAWAVQVMQWNDETHARIVRSWKWSRREATSPPFAVSNDGRYLAILSKPVQLFDTSSLTALNDEKLSAMLNAASAIRPKLEQYYRLTQNLNYLVFKPAQDTKNDSSAFEASGRTYSRKWYSAFVDRRNCRVGAFPDKLNFKDRAASPIFFQQAAESNDGKLLLLYGQYQPKSGGGLYTIRGEDLGVRHEIFVRPYSARSRPVGAPGRSWDPAKSRMLFYETSDLAQYRQRCVFRIWDYKADTLRTISLDVATAFRREGNSFVPNLLR